MKRRTVAPCKVVKTILIQKTKVKAKSSEFSNPVMMYVVFLPKREEFKLQWLESVTMATCLSHNRVPQTILFFSLSFFFCFIFFCFGPGWLF